MMVLVQFRLVALGVASFIVHSGCVRGDADSGVVDGTHIALDQPSAPAGGAHDDFDDDEILRNLQFRMGTSGPLPRASGNSPEQRTRRYRDFVAAQLAQDAFYDTVLAAFYPMLQGTPGPLPFRLQAATVDGVEILFGIYPVAGAKPNATPCRPSDAVAVHPWWDLESTVRICSDSYLPDVRKRPDGSYCEATYPRIDREGCGCGEHLANCATSDDQAKAIGRAYREEAIRTMEWVIQSGKPFEGIFSGNVTVRSELAEFFYARNRWFHGKPFVLAPIARAAPPRPRPRDLEFAAGVLDTPEFRTWHEAPRVIVEQLYEAFLCMPLRSRQVQGAQLFKLASADLRAKPQLELTEMEGCRDCHARLEYSMMFFSGFANIRDGFRYTPDPHHGNSRFYGFDSTDLRGEAPATIASFGRGLVGFPEFVPCQVDHMVDFVYGASEPGELVRSDLVKLFASKRDFARVFTEAIVRRYVVSARPPDVTPTAPVADLIKEQCSDCHDTMADGPDLTLEALSHDRDHALRVALEVAADHMPPPPAALQTATKRFLILELCALAAVSARDCEAAYLPQLRTAETLANDAVFRAISSKVASTDNSPDRAQLKDRYSSQANGWLDSRKASGHRNPTSEAAVLLLTAELCERDQASVEEIAHCMQSLAVDRNRSLAPARPEERR